MRLDIYFFKTTAKNDFFFFLSADTSLCTLFIFKTTANKKWYIFICELRITEIDHEYNNHRIEIMEDLKLGE